MKFTGVLLLLGLWVNTHLFGATHSYEVDIGLSLAGCITASPDKYKALEEIADYLGAELLNNVPIDIENELDFIYYHFKSDDLTRIKTQKLIILLLSIWGITNESEEKKLYDYSREFKKLVLYRIRQFNLETWIETFNCMYPYFMTFLSYDL